MGLEGGSQSSVREETGPKHFSLGTQLNEDGKWGYFYNGSQLKEDQKQARGILAAEIGDGDNPSLFGEKRTIPGMILSLSDSEVFNGTSLGIDSEVDKTFSFIGQGECSFTLLEDALDICDLHVGLEKIYANKIRVSGGHEIIFHEPSDMRELLRGDSDISQGLYIKAESGFITVSTSIRNGLKGASASIRVKLL